MAYDMYGNLVPDSMINSQLPMNQLNQTPYPQPQDPMSYYLKQAFPALYQQQQQPQQQYPQYQQPQQPAQLNCTAVTSIDEARATTPNPLGQLTVFAETSGKHIYTKQLDIDGIAQFRTFTLIETTTPSTPVSAEIAHTETQPSEFANAKEVEQAFTTLVTTLNELSAKIDNLENGKVEENANTKSNIPANGTESTVPSTSSKSSKQS